MEPATGSLDSPQVDPGTIIRRTIEFIFRQLAPWRDDPTRDASVTAENDLNAQLCKFLNVVARREFSMVLFHSEERQVGSRRVDLSAQPCETIQIGPRSFSLYDPFLVIEGKRLPAPSTDREREYVIGTNRNGGIERFKLGLHGVQLSVAVLVGYVQEGKSSNWHDTINAWIGNLPKNADSVGESWPEDEQLQALSINTGHRTSSCESEHQRQNATSDRICLHHLWVEMAS